MANQSLTVRLTAQVGGYVSAMRGAQQATDELGDSQEQVSQQSQQSSADLDSFANKAGALGLGIAAGVGLAVKTFADFDQAMSGVRAQLGGTGTDMGKLETAIRQAGASSVYSSTEAAEAAEELAKAGLNGAQIMGGALSGALQLAASDNLSMADAATYAANAMATFGLKAKDVGHISDVLANGAVMSTASVKSLAQGMSQAGLVAKSMGLNLEDTVGTLAAFDQAGLKGSDAGTSLKTMLTALANPSAKAAAEMKRLGINVYDAQGNFVGMEKLAGILQDRLGGLTQQQRNAAMATIFGSDAIRSANVLYEEGEKGIGKWIKGVNKAGTAALIAAKKQDNLKGDLEKLQGALQDLFIGAGSGVDGPLRHLTQWATNFLTVTGKLPDSVKSVGLGLAGLGAAGLLGFAGLHKVSGAFRNARTDIRAARGALRAWSVAAGGSGTLISGLAARVRTLGARFRSLGRATKIGIGVATVAVLALGTAMTQTGEAQENYGRSTSKLTDDLIKAATKGKGLSGVFSDLQIAMKPDKSVDLAQGFKLLNRETQNWIGTVTNAPLAFTNWGNGATTEIDAIKERLKALGEALAGLVQDGHADIAAKAFAKIQKTANKAGISTKELNRLMPAYASAIQDVTNKQNTGASADEKRRKAQEDLAEKIRATTDAYKGLNNALLEQRGSARGYQAALDDATQALKDNGRNLDITTKKGQANQEALDGIVSSTGKWASSTYDATHSVEQANAIVSAGREQFVKMATAMGMSRSRAKDLAESLFKLPKGVKTDVKVPGVDDAIFKVDKMGNLVAHIKGKKVVIPASTPNAALVIQLLQNIDGAAVKANGRRVSIPTAALKATGTYREIMNIDGAALSADKKSVSIPTKALNTSDTIAELLRVRQAARDKTMHIITKYSTIGAPPAPPRGGRWAFPGAAEGGAMPGLAAGGQDHRAGGAVRGLGTATSDSIMSRLTAGPVALSNGEHVWTAEEVALAGGHAAMYAWRQAVKDRKFRVPGYATGGAARDWSRVQATSTGPRTVVIRESGQPGATYDIDINATSDKATEIVSELSYELRRQELASAYRRP